jgi:hypothetical protein
MNNKRKMKKKKKDLLVPGLWDFKQFFPGYSNVQLELSLWSVDNSFALQINILPCKLIYFGSTSV